MLHLNSQVRQNDGFTPRRRVFGRTPKIPIGTVDNPLCKDFKNPKNTPATQAHQVLAKQRGIRKESPRSGFNGKFNVTLNQHVQDMKRTILLCQTAYSHQRKPRNKTDLKWQWAVIAIGRFRRKGDLVYPRWDSMEVYQK